MEINYLESLITKPITKLHKGQSSKRYRVLIHCQYVFGIGHFVRTVELARNLSRLFDVSVISGGEPVPNYNLPHNVEWIQMPAIYKEESCDELKSVDTSKSVAQCFFERNEILECVVRKVVPDLLITEHFPFGLLFEEEVIALIEKVKNCNTYSKIISSVRDIIESKNGGTYDERICEILNCYYDLVMVHGDDRVIPFETSFPQISLIKIPLSYTGYIVRKVKKNPKKTSVPTIVASIGGGRLGNEMLISVLESHSYLHNFFKHDLIIFSGAFQKMTNELSKNLLPSVKIMHFDEDAYNDALSNASLVICMGGYNSIIEAITAKVPVLVYQRKFYGNNQEQECRIELFKKFGLLDSFNSDELAPENITNIILNNLSKPRTLNLDINTNGAEEASHLIMSLFKTV
jgi:predicted glycosyltransferase